MKQAIILGFAHELEKLSNAQLAQKLTAFKGKTNMPKPATIKAPPIPKAMTTPSAQMMNLAPQGIKP